MGKKFEQFIVDYADRVLHWRWLIIIVTLFSVIGLASGGRHLDFSTNYRVFFSDANPELQTYEEFQNMYTKSDNIVFVIQPKDGKIFTPKITKVMEEITEQAWRIPYATRVDSLTNFQYSWADGDDLTVEDLVRNGHEMSQAELDRREKIALTEPLLQGNLISPDANTAGINVTLNLPQKSISEVPEAANAARAIQNAVMAEHPELKIVLSGVSMMNNAFGEAGMADMQTLVPLMYLFLVITMFISLRSASGTFSTLLVVGASTMVAMGIAGFIGVKLNPVSATAPTVILTLAIADSIHILISMLSFMREGNDKRSAIIESLRINFLPVTITSVTTIIGFLSLNFSDAPPFWHLGNITAMGIAAAWILSLTFLPALMSVLPVKAAPRQDGKADILHQWLGNFADFVIAHSTKILIIMSVLSIGLVMQVRNIDLNDEFVKYFDQRLPFRQGVDFATKHLNGVYVLEYSVKADSPSGISEPAYLENLERFVSWLRIQPEVTHVFSYTDIIKRLNKNMHGDDPKWHKIPDDRNLAAQYLLLYELSLPYGLDLNDRINIDKSATRLSITIDNISTVEIRDFIDRSENWLKQNTPQYMHAKATSPTVMFAYISHRNIQSMLRGNAVAIFMIALVMMIALRSFCLGALSLIPNSVPIMATFGIWAILVGQVGMAAATVAATSLGIIVDDSVHFLTKYLRARREQGLDRAQAIRYAFQTVGVALTVTTVVLAIGFSVLAMSTFLINAQMGMLTALAIVIALIIDFLLLPALLLIGYKKTNERT